MPCLRQGQGAYVTGTSRPLRKSAVYCKESATSAVFCDNWWLPDASNFEMLNWETDFYTPQMLGGAVLFDNSAPAVYENSGSLGHGIFIHRWR